MQKPLLVVAVLLFALAIALACTPTSTVSPNSAQPGTAGAGGNASLTRPAAAAGGAVFVSPIQTPTTSPVATSVPGATTTPQRPPSRVEISLAFSGPVVPNQAATVNISILAREAVASSLLFVSVKDRSGANMQTYSMTLTSLARNEVRELSQPVMIPSANGTYSIAAALSDVVLGGTYYGFLSFAVNNGQYVPNPTPWPDGVPAPLATPSTAVPPTLTPQVRVTAVPPATAVATETARSPGGGQPAVGRATNTNGPLQTYVTISVM
jgi:hypothetical protein